MGEEEKEYREPREILKEIKKDEKELKSCIEKITKIL